jgi:transcriptional regulator with XRE-family HTH domain
MTRKIDSPAKEHLRAGIGSRLLALRTVLQMSQAALAKTIGESQNTYQKWEAGDIFPEPTAMLQLCAKYQIDFNYLFQHDFGGLPGNLAARLGQLLPPKD